MSFASLDDQDFKERVRQATDIVELIGGDSPLRRSGRGFVTHCPWHEDKRPSLQVNPARQSWKCWVCDIGGDVFNYVMKRDGVQFPEALQMLAEQAGIPAPAHHQRRAEPGSPDDKRALMRAVAWAEQQLHRYLLEDPAAEDAREYLHQRGINDESIRLFRVGFAPKEWSWLADRARNTEFSPAVLEATGMLGRSEKSGRYYDRFRGRVMFSIRNPQGQPIAFGGRVLPQLAEERDAKYINTSDTRIFIKSDHLYGLDVARSAVAKAEEIVVVEGYTDVIMAHQFGVDHVVAVLGTALNEKHIKLLTRYTDRVTLVLDGDEAGQKRTNDILDLFIAAQLDLRILTLPESQDPCDFLLQQGADAFRGLLGSAVDALEHKVLVTTQGIDLAKDTHQANRALEEILATMAKSPASAAQVGSGMNLREQQILLRLSNLFGVDAGQIRSRLKAVRGENRSRLAARGRRLDTAESTKPSVATRSTRVMTTSSMDRLDIELLEILTQYPDYVELATSKLDADLLKSEATQQIFRTVRALKDGGHSVDFGNILTALDDEQLKSIWVELDDRAGKKEPDAQEDALHRLERLIDAYHFTVAEKGRRHDMAALQEKKLNEEEELYVLQKLIAQERHRQGLSGPTDG